MNASASSAAVIAATVGQRVDQPVSKPSPVSVPFAAAERVMVGVSVASTGRSPTSMPANGRTGVSAVVVVDAVPAMVGAGLRRGPRRSHLVVLSTVGAPPALLRSLSVNVVSRSCRPPTGVKATRRAAGDRGRGSRQRVDAAVLIRSPVPRQRPAGAVEGDRQRVGRAGVLFADRHAGERLDWRLRNVVWPDTVPAIVGATAGSLSITLVVLSTAGAPPALLGR